MDLLEKALENTTKRNLIKDLFEGKICKKLTCYDCNNISEKIENMISLKIHFP